MRATGKLYCWLRERHSCLLKCQSSQSQNKIFIKKKNQALDVDDNVFGVFIVGISLVPENARLLMDKT